MLTEGGHPLTLPRFMLLTARCSVPNLQVSGGRKAELWGSFWGPAPEAWVSKAPALQQDWGGKKRKGKIQHGPATAVPTCTASCSQRCTSLFNLLN